MVHGIYRLMNKYPEQERYCLCAQMRRSAVSVTSNIAEGTSRSSMKDKIHFIEIAYGSLMELLSQLQVSFDLGYITEAEYFHSDRDWFFSYNKGCKSTTCSLQRRGRDSNSW